MSTAVAVDVSAAPASPPYRIPDGHGGTLPHDRHRKRPDHFDIVGRRKERPGDDLIRQRIEESRRPKQMSPGASVQDAVDLANEAIGLDPEQARLFSIGAMAKAVAEMGGWDALGDDGLAFPTTPITPTDPTDPDPVAAALAVEVDQPLWADVDILPATRRRPHRRSYVLCDPKPVPPAPRTGPERQVVDLNSGKTYASVREAAKALGIGKSTVAANAAAKAVPSKFRHHLWPVRLAYLDEVEPEVVSAAKGVA